MGVNRSAVDEDAKFSLLRHERYSLTSSSLRPWKHLLTILNLQPPSINPDERYMRELLAVLNHQARLHHHASSTQKTKTRFFALHLLAIHVVKSDSTQYHLAYIDAKSLIIVILASRSGGEYKSKKLLFGNENRAFCDRYDFASSYEQVNSLLICNNAKIRRRTY